MKVLWAVFRKEWTEAKRDPRAWLLTLFVPVLFYPGAMWLGAGGAGQGPMLVAVGDSWLGERLDDLGEVEVVKSGHGGRVDAEIEVVARDPDFPDHGVIRVDVRVAGSSLIAGELLDRALDQVGSGLAAERAERAGMSAGDLEPVRKAKVAAAGAAAGSAPLIAYLLVFVMFTGCLATAVDTGAGERERGGLEAMLATPAPPLAIAAGKVAFVMLTGVASVVASLVGLALAMRVGGGGFSAVAGGTEGVLVTALLMIPCAGMIASWLFACSLGARSAREAHAWISGVFLMVSLGLIWLTFGSGGGGGLVSWLPLFGAAGAISEVLAGNVGAGAWLPAWISTTAGWGLGMMLCARLLRREAVMRAW